MGVSKKGSKLPSLIDSEYSIFRGYQLKQICQRFEFKEILKEKLKDPKLIIEDFVSKVKEKTFFKVKEEGISELAESMNTSFFILTRDLSLSCRRIASAIAKKRIYSLFKSKYEGLDFDLDQLYDKSIFLWEKNFHSSVDKSSLKIDTIYAKVLLDISRGIPNYDCVDKNKRSDELNKYIEENGGLEKYIKNNAETFVELSSELVRKFHKKIREADTSHLKLSEAAVEVEESLIEIETKKLELDPYNYSTLQMYNSCYESILSKLDQDPQITKSDVEKSYKNIDKDAVSKIYDLAFEAKLFGAIVNHSIIQSSYSGFLDFLRINLHELVNRNNLALDDVNQLREYLDI